MVMFNRYVSLPEGIFIGFQWFPLGSADCRIGVSGLGLVVRLRGSPEIIQDEAMEAPSKLGISTRMDKNDGLTNNKNMINGHLEQLKYRFTYQFCTCCFFWKRHVTFDGKKNEEELFNHNL